LLTGATLILKRIKGIDRPALGTLIPNKKSFTFMVDSGANIDSKPAYLAQYAKMGSAYMEIIMGIKNPKVGLINIGAEKEKGNALVKEAYPLLEEASVNFIGNVEPRDIPYGAVDVMVCDAFVGNVILKYTEGLASALLGMIKEALYSKAVYKMGALLAKGAFKKIKKSFEYEDIGGAPFLGLTALVVKAHGSSNQRAIKGAINQCYIAYKNDLANKIAEKM
jgi:glycerol-3-phosphate acyltransferase PlsX